MAKTEHLPFDVDAWLNDEELSRCSASTRGIWMDLLCRMQINGRTGEIAGTAETLAGRTRCTPQQFIDAARELRDHQAANVRFDGTTFYFRNRRMTRSAARRKAAAERQMRYRHAHSNGNVTPEDIAFDRFWNVFPRGRKGNRPGAREAFRKAAEKIDVETIIRAAIEYAASEKGQGKFVQGPEPWLNQERWNDDREAWRDLDRKQPPKPKEYREVTRDEFKALMDSDQFLTRPQTQPAVCVGSVSFGI
jgi:hypothetical protein